MFDTKPSSKSANGKKLEVALLLNKQYEDAHFSIPYPDPIETIKLKMIKKNQSIWRNPFALVFNV